MGKKNQATVEVTISKREEKKIRKMLAMITFHEARGGNRPGKVGDKRGHWSENLDWDQVQLLKLQIEEIHENSRKRSWGHPEAVKDMGTRKIRDAFEEKRKADEKKIKDASIGDVEGSPTSVLSKTFQELPPALAI